MFLTSCTTQENNNSNNIGDSSSGDKNHQSPPVNPGDGNNEVAPPPNNETIPPNNNDSNNKQENNELVLPSIEFEKRWWDGIVRTKYSTNSYIKSRYSIEETKTYTNDELKEMWDEDKFEINDFPYPNNPNGLNFDRERYKKLIRMYGKLGDDDNKLPMMHELSLKQLLENNKIKKHPIADYQYGIDYHVTSETKAVEKVFDIDINEKGYISTGLFLPPGEMIEITFNNLEENEITKNNDGYYFFLHLGNNENYNIDEYFINDEQVNYPRFWPYRMPSLRTRTTTNKKTFRFGTPFGGLVHLENFTNVSNRHKKSISVTIKGAVETINYVHGKTTVEDWNDQIKRFKNKNNENKITAPIFDFSTDNMNFYDPISKLNLDKYDNANSQRSYPQKIMDWWD